MVAAPQVLKMSDSLIGKKKCDLETPALLVDLDIFEENIARMSAYCRDNGCAWRPHTKAYKCPDIARLLLKAGAIGVTCANLPDAEVMADAGIDDILIANQVVTPGKLRRLAALQRRTRVICTLDNFAVVERMADAARKTGTTIPVLIDIDIGMNRTGIRPGAPVLELARAILAAEGLGFEGIMGYEGHILGVKPPGEKMRQCGQALDRLLECRDLLAANGVPVAIVSAGGTGCYSITAAYKGITEVQAGGGIFMDAKYREQFSVDTLDFALTVLGTVTSRHPTHLVLDAGFKVMSAYHEPPRTLDRKDLIFRYLSSDCGVWEITEGSEGPRVGDQVELIVGYSDSTMFLHRRLIGLRDAVVEKVWEIVLPS